MDTIVVGIDFSKTSLAAMGLASDVAVRAEADLLIVWVETAEKDRCEAEAELKRMCSDLASKMTPGNKVSYRIVSGRKVYTALNSVVKQEQADLLVIGSHGNSGFDEKFAGANTYKTITISSAPVLSVRENFNFDKPLERLVMPIDSTRDTRQKVPWTIEFAKMFPNTTIHVLGIHTTKNKTVRGEVEGYVSSVERLLDKEKMNYVTDYVDAENTTLSTIEYAEKINADLIVIMTEQEKTLSNIFLGPYAQQMINQSPIPVLAVSVKQINGESR